MLDFSRFNSLVSIFMYFSSNDKCLRFLEQERWGKVVICPYCGQTHAHHRANGRWQCYTCHKSFSVLQGTIFENTKIPMVKWFAAMYLISSHKKGIASTQLARDIAVTQKTAWFILHKVRTLYKQDESVLLSGTVQCDEMYFGGKETNKHECKKVQGTQGRSLKTKTPIFGMMEINSYTDEEGNKHLRTYVRAMTMLDSKRDTIYPLIDRYIQYGSHIITDELPAYHMIDEIGNYTHSIVNHRLKEFSVDGITTNGIEGFWGLFRRMVLGIYHYVSRRYLSRYIDEMVYRWNTSHLEPMQRFEYMFSAAIGKVQYKDVKIVG